jgi:lysophospholipase L1-like esterase
MKRILLILVGIFLAFLFLEAGLQIASLFVKKTVTESQEIIIDEYDKNKKIILCVGDSYTHGVGASEGESYPDWLEAMLDKTYPDKYKVINLGVPGINTEEQLEILRSALQMVKVDIVITIGGMNDHWSFNNVSAEAFTQSIWSRLKIKAYKLRVYKLMRIIRQNLISRSVPQTFFDGQLQDITDRVHTRRYPDEQSVLSDAQLLLDKIAQNKHNVNAYNLLGSVYADLLRQPARAIEILTEGINNNPDEVMLKETLCMMFIGEENIEMAVKLAEDMYKHDADSKYLDLWLVMETIKSRENFRQAIAERTKNNLYAMRQLCMDKNIVFVLSSYPNFPRDSRIKIDNYIDTYKAFENIPLTDTKYFVQDGHCTGEGYKLMAKTIFDYLSEKGLINEN